jgi:hypothetical protein
MAHKCAIVWVGLWIIAHAELAGTVSIGMTPVQASEVVLGNVNTAETALDCKSAYIRVCRAATFAIRLLGWAVGFGIGEVTANKMVAIGFQTLILATLALAVRQLFVRGAFGCRSVVCYSHAQELTCANLPVHFASSRSTGLALSRCTVLDIWCAHTLELTEFVLTTHHFQDWLGGQDLACSSLRLDRLCWIH